MEEELEPVPALKGHGRLPFFRPNLLIVPSLTTLWVCELQVVVPVQQVKSTASIKMHEIDPSYVKETSFTCSVKSTKIYSILFFYSIAICMPSDELQFIMRLQVNLGFTRTFKILHQLIYAGL